MDRTMDFSIFPELHPIFLPSEFLGFFGRFFGNLTPSEGIFGWRTGWASELHSDVRVGLAPSVLMSK